MIDFDKLFEKYLAKWYQENADEMTAEEMENQIPEVYEKWVTSPCVEAGGKSPEQYFEDITDADTLIKMFVDSERDGGAPSLLLARIAMVSECAKGLSEVICSEKDETVVIEAMNLLCEMNESHPLEKYIEFIVTGSHGEGVAELGAEILKEYAPLVKDNIFAVLSTATVEQKEIFADILVETDKDDRIYALLEELFKTSKNIPYIAGLIGKYGDERCVQFLYPALDECNYLEFIEIRSAIENLGGVVDDSYRDFSDDEYYKAIKNLK